MVLGFGDRSFPGFCAYAEEVAKASAAKGCPQLLGFATIDRQSPREFARWGRALGAALGIGLELLHQPVVPASEALTLISRRDYGAEVQAPTAILRLAAPRVSAWQRLTGQGFARWQAGDLLGDLPEGSPVPRFYSLASGSRGGFVEIVVRKQPGGLCSGQLAELQPGGTVRAFLRRSPGFRPERGRAPLILVGAGKGVGPLAGFIRANARRRPVHLFFGMRHADSGFLYREELAARHGSGRLSCHVTANSRRAPAPRPGRPAARGGRDRLPDPRGRAGDGLRRARHGGGRPPRAGRDPCPGRADARAAESLGTLCRRRLPTRPAMR